MIRLALLAILISQWSAAVFAEDVISMATGVRGVRAIVKSKQWQNDLGVTPDQLDQLRAMFADKQLMDRLQEFGGVVATLPELSVDAASVRAADKIYSEVFTKILTAEQLNERRLLYLRTRFTYPLDIFDTDFFHQLGLSDEEYKQLEPQWIAVTTASRDRVDDVRRNCIGKLLAVSPDCKSKFVECFGTQFLPKSESLNGKVSLKSLGIVDTDGGNYFLNSASILILSNEASPDQRRQLDDLHHERLRLAAKDRNFDRAKMLMDGVNKILNESQRLEILELNHSHAVRDNLNIVASKSVLAYLQIDGKAAEDFKTICFQGQKEVHEARLKTDKDSLPSITRLLPNEAQKIVAELLADVWPEKP